MFLQYLSELCLCSNLIAFEKAPIHVNLKYTLIVFNSVFITFGSVLNFQKLFCLVTCNENRVPVFLQSIFNFIDLFMKHYLRNAYLERSMNQSLYETDFIATSCKTIIFCKNSHRHFFLYTVIVNVLTSFLARTS